jgi:hypothetical protein
MPSQVSVAAFSVLTSLFMLELVVKSFRCFPVALASAGYRIFRCYPVAPAETDGIISDVSPVFLRMPVAASSVLPRRSCERGLPHFISGCRYVSVKCRDPL